MLCGVQDLDHDLKSEIGGHFLHCVESAFALPAVFDARELNKAMHVSWKAIADWPTICVTYSD